MTEEEASNNQETVVDFVHLHNHTHYSLLDGLQKIPTLIDHVVALGQKAVAITDHGTLSGAIEFYKVCKKKGVKPIIGIETYVAPRLHTDKSSQEDRTPFHLILLAKNFKGYQNLMRLSTTACLDGFYYKPRIDHALLEQYHEGLICLSGCVGGELGTHIQNGNMERALEIAQWYKNLFGKENYYLEMQPHIEWEPQRIVNAGLREIAKTLDLDLVITGDAHYTKAEDHYPHDILLCVQTGNIITDENRMKLDQDLSVRSGAYLLERFPDDAQAIANTVKVASLCDLEIELGKILIPTFEVPEGETEKSYLRKMVFHGAGWRYGGLKRHESEEKTVEEIMPLLPEHVLTRIEYELEVVGKMGYEGYFLIVADLISWSKKNGIICGPGRGSAAGSIVAYCTTITELDPLPYGLLFERFLNPDRISMPDIDMDYADDRRGEVIEYATQKYGQDRVAQIITFGVMAARNAVRDTGRVLGMPYAEVDAIAKLIPAPVQGRHVPLSKSIVEDPELKKEYDNNSRAKELIDIAMKLEGTIRNAGVHAAGVVISKDPIVEHTPLVRAQKGVISTQYSMGPIEDLGLLKFDFLGLANLTIIKNTLRIMRRAYSIDLDMNDIPIDDVATYELLTRGDTTGVFQLESAGMKRYIKELRPNRFEDIVAMVALYRPGPMQWIDDFIKRKHNPELITYEHPKMEEALKNTYGIIVYQEQVMQISKDLCGFTGGQADTLRKAIGKKQLETLAKMKKEFVDGAIEHSGAKPEFLESLWKSLEDFAAYCFNKSHAACYALISVQTAYLKAHYPDAFMAALLTSDKDDLDRIAIEIDECRSMGLLVVAPDVNESFMDFAVVPNEKKIRYALSAIKNVGEGPITVIEEARKNGGVFTSLEDFLSRTASGEINKKSLESLVKAGALDEFGERATLIASMDNMLAFANQIRKNEHSGQIDIFGSLAGTDKVQTLHMVVVEPASSKQKLDWERELVGVYVSGHPLDSYKDILLGSGLKPIIEVGVGGEEGKEVRVAGVISSIQKIYTKKNEAMLFVKIEDLTGIIEVLVFPKKLAADVNFWVDGKVVAVRGKLSLKDGAAKILLEEAKELKIGKKMEDERVVVTGQIVIHCHPGTDKTMLERLKHALIRHDGGAYDVFLVLATSSGEQKIKTNLAVMDDDAMRLDVRSALGYEPEFEVLN
ncbi:MAG: DNA polymerase III subunit alpha [Patescibacteria group bacterium]